MRMWNWLRRTTRDFWLRFRQDGAKAVLNQLREALRGRIYVSSDQVVLVTTLRDETPPANDRMRVEDLEPRHLPIVAEYNRRQASTRRTHAFKRALDGGEHAFLCFVDGELVGWFWWMDSARAARGFYLSRFGVALAPGEVYGYNFRIDTEHRAGGTATEFLARVEAELAQRGYERMYGFVDSWNRPARWLYTVRGYEVVRRARIRTLLGRVVVVDRTVFLEGPTGVRPLVGMVGGD